jgi:hypothetical protein
LRLDDIADRIVFADRDRPNREALKENVEE